MKKKTLTGTFVCIQRGTRGVPARWRSRNFVCLTLNEKGQGNKGETLLGKEKERKSTKNHQRGTGQLKSMVK
jgi:hypothetical protein